MAEFSGKIIEVHYMDTEYSIVEVLYEGDDGKVYSHALRADSENKDYQDLLAEGWDTNKIIEETVASKKAQSATWNIQVNAAATALVKELLTKETEKLSDFEKLALSKLSESSYYQYEKRRNSDLEGQDIYNFIVNKNTDKDELFKFKLWALELDFVKDKDKETKLKLRKVQTILEGLSIISDLNQ